MYTTVQVRVPAGLSGASSGRLKSRNLASNRGETFRPAKAKQVPRNPQAVIFSRRCRAAVPEVHNPRLGSRGTTAAFHALAFVPATNDAAACVRVCVCHHRILQQQQ